MKLWALDPYAKWGDAVVATGNGRGWQCRRISRGEHVERGGYGFIRLSMEPLDLELNRKDYAVMSKRLTMIQDPTQIAVYENKSAQFARWADWMPDTWRITDKDQAMSFAASAEYPLVSKADTGASSRNVRILKDRTAAEQHIAEVFGRGVTIDRGRIQRGYVLLQRFIPHEITYRVNALGDCRAVFFRRCYPDKPVAQTGNVDPAFEMTPELESLLDFSDRFFAHAQTKWCAIDILKDGDSWKLLETSEGWPWPSPGRCNEGTIFRSSRPRKWGEMMEVLFDELERGAWSAS